MVYAVLGGAAVLGLIYATVRAFLLKEEASMREPQDLECDLIPSSNDSHETNKLDSTTQ